MWNVIKDKWVCHIIGRGITGTWYCDNILILFSVELLFSQPVGMCREFQAHVLVYMSGVVMILTTGPRLTPTISIRQDTNGGVQGDPIPTIILCNWAWITKYYVFEGMLLSVEYLNPFYI